MRQTYGATDCQIISEPRPVIARHLATMFRLRRYLRELWLACPALIFVLAAIPARATIRYDVSLAHPAEHTFHVTMTSPDVKGSVLVQMPAWDALYQIRDFAFRVTEMHASSGAERLAITKIDKQTWRINVQGGQGEVRVEYASFWNDPRPFGTQLSAEHAFMNLAMVLCYVPDRRAEQTQVHFTDLPQGWQVAVELPSSGASQNLAYSAPSYGALVDAPVEIGQFDAWQFQAAGRPIRVVVHGESVDHANVTRMLTQIVEYESQLMGGPPFTEYMFIYHVGRNFGGGGMEHMNSTAIGAASAAALLNVSAHEFFHLWNVKRIRPQSLEPRDYTREMYTPSLWFAEGVTNTYASYTLVRTGLWSKSQFLTDLGDQITELESRPAHRWQSAEESSLDAWLEKYPIYDSADFSVSYYNIGQLLGVALDISIRDATDNRASLDDVLRRLNHDYAQQGRFYPESAGIQAAIEQVVRDANSDAKLDPKSETKFDAGDFFRRYIAGANDLPFADLLARAGLALKAQGQPRAALGFMVSRGDSGADVVSDVDYQSAAAHAGIRDGDALVQIDGADVPRNLGRWLRSHQPGDIAHVSIRRGDSLSDVTFALGEESARSYEVVEIQRPSERQRRILDGMLHGTTSGVADAR